MSTATSTDTRSASPLVRREMLRVPVQGHTLSGLVNNVGIAIPAPLIYQPSGEFRRQLEVNLVGSLIVT